MLIGCLKEGPDGEYRLTDASGSVMCEVSQRGRSLTLTQQEEESTAVEGLQVTGGRRRSRQKPEHEEHFLTLSSSISWSVLRSKCNLI